MAIDRVLVIGFVVALTLASSTSALGQEASVDDRIGTMGTEFMVSPEPGLGDVARDPSVALNEATNRYLVVWQGTVDGHSGVYSRRVSGSGYAKGRVIRIASEGDGQQFNVTDVVYNPLRNEFFAVWSDWAGSTFTDEHATVYGRRLSGIGEPLGEIVQITNGSGLAVPDEGAPSIAFNSRNDEYLVVWTDLRDRGTPYVDVYGQRIRGDGSLEGTNVRISNAGAPIVNWARPDVAYNSVHNQYMVVWQEGSHLYDAPLHIKGQRVSSSGDRIGPVIRVSDQEYATRPSIAFNSVKAQYLVAWEDITWSDRDVRVRLVSPSGRALGSSAIVGATGVSSDKARPAAGYNPLRNRYTVVWEDERRDARGFDIYGQYVGPNGPPIWEDFIISGPQAFDGEYEPAVAVHPAWGQTLVVWEEDRAGLFVIPDIFARPVR